MGEASKSAISWQEEDVQDFPREEDSVKTELRLSASTAGNAGLIPGRGFKIPHVVWCGQKKKKEDAILPLAADRQGP